MYKVVWKTPARDRLAALWLGEQSAARSAITAATAAADRRLARDPLGIGESRADGQRVMFEFPLGIQYEVDLADTKVRVMWVWLFRDRRA
jgi:hypothetical protein